jgi:hypothetical protein
LPIIDPPNFVGTIDPNRADDFSFHLWNVPNALPLRLRDSLRPSFAVQMAIAASSSTASPA